MLKDKDKSRKSKKGKKGTSENENKIPQVGDVLLTGQVRYGSSYTFICRGYVE